MIKFLNSTWSLFPEKLNTLTDTMQFKFDMANTEYAGAGRGNHPTAYDRYTEYHNPPKEEDEVA